MHVVGYQYHVIQTSGNNSMKDIGVVPYVMTLVLLLLIVAQHSVVATYIRG